MTPFRPGQLHQSQAALIRVTLDFWADTPAFLGTYEYFSAKTARLIRTELYVDARWFRLACLVGGSDDER
jgi:hypothetical protein